MKKIEINWHVIAYDEFIYENNSILKLFIDEKKYLELLKNLDKNSVIVLGWDWTMLKAIEEFKELEKPFLWLNFWNKWFLLNDFNYYNSNEIIEKKYPLLEIDLIAWEQKKVFYAFNEVDLRAWNWRIITLETILNSKNSISIAWDGIIISTPAWSTGYNNSLWWPIIPHEIQAFVITPKAPFNPKWQTSIMISQKEILTIRNIWRKNTLQIYSDSNLVYSWTWESVSIKVKKSKKEVTFLIFKDYLETWEEKVLLEQWFAK